MVLDESPDWVSEFERSRTRLLGIAYRVLGSFAEAQDVVQDTFVSWMHADRTEIRNPQAWLTTVCTRKAIDALRSARLSRTDYVGAWLPEPVETRHLTGGAPEDDLADAATMAFLFVLESLGPKERAAFILRDVFDMASDDVADALGVSPPACRKLLSRARAKIPAMTEAYRPGSDHLDMLSAFEHAIKTGETDALKKLLARDVELRADSGGKAVAIREPLLGRDGVIRFVGRVLSPSWSGNALVRQMINAEPALVLYENGRPSAVIAFGYGPDGKVSRVFITRNPDKMSHVPPAAAC